MPEIGLAVLLNSVEEPFYGSQTASYFPENIKEHPENRPLLIPKIFFIDFNQPRVFLILTIISLF